MVFKKALEGPNGESVLITGLEIKGCLEPRTPFISSAVLSIFCREPKDVLVSLHNTNQ